jgi:hypothetical protein
MAITVYMAIKVYILFTGFIIIHQMNTSFDFKHFFFKKKKLKKRK